MAKFMRKQKLAMLLFCIAIALLLAACSSTNPSDSQTVPGADSPPGFTRHQSGFLDTFDTYIQILIYTETPQEFNAHFTAARDAFMRYHALFDIFNSYDGIYNINTINENAGIAPVPVDQAIIDLLLVSRQAYFDSDGALNITLGPVLSIWHEYRTHGLANPDSAAIPSYADLRQAAALADINGLIIDEETGTVFLAQEGMSLDVGAVAKSFAVGRVAELLRERGVIAAVVDAGGDIATIGGSMADGGRPWGIGVRDPLTNGMFDSVRVYSMSAATSGNNHRTYMVDAIAYNHIIDPVTLMPATNFASVTVVHEDINIAEMLSTALFILSFEIGYDLAQAFDAAVIWIFDDGTAESNERYRELSANFN